ncbi:unnamed protein product [Larinioides sclopetarius]|uniref:Protein Wnt n=1 Tax=Larinioides sclopetarius TaxID=280406 RepID=A0AAV2AV44_9ARAC
MKPKCFFHLQKKREKNLWNFRDFLSSEKNLFCRDLNEQLSQNMIGVRTRILLLILVAVSFPQNVIGTWWLLSRLQLSSAHADTHLLCGGVPGLTRKQREICERHPDILLSVSKGARMGVAECQAQFRYHRWNCSTLDTGTSVFGNHMLKGFLLFFQWTVANLPSYTLSAQLGSPTPSSDPAARARFCTARVIPCAGASPTTPKECTTGAGARTWPQGSGTPGDSSTPRKNEGRTPRGSSLSTTTGQEEKLYSVELVCSASAMV